MPVLTPAARRNEVRRRRLVALTAIAAVLLVFGGLVCASVRGPDAQAAIEGYVADWRRGDYNAMYERISNRSTALAGSAEEFAQRFRDADATATTAAMRIGEPRKVDDESWGIPIEVRTRAFGPVRGLVTMDVIDEGGEARVVWKPHDAFPGLRAGEQLARTTVMGPRGTLLARDGTVLAAGPARTGDGPAAAADIVGKVGPIPPEQAAELEQLGYPADATVGLTGLERIFDRDLSGAPGGTLHAGDRVLASRQPKQPPAVRTSIAPAIQTAAVDALAGRLGGIAVVAPRTGEVLAAAGIAFSGLQPPGSTFKIITAAAALEAGITSPGKQYPPQTSATLSGVELENSFGGSCGGTLVESFAKSCNSVFAPLGAELGAQKLVAGAEAFGFNKPLAIPGAATSTIPPAAELGDDLGVGSSAIGQGRVQATALQMAIVAAAIGLRGRLPQVTVRAHRWRSAPTTKAVSSKTARQVERMMEAVVKPGGTGSAAAIEGVRVAGKTGTAELRSTVGCVPDPANPEACPTEGDPENTDAWFAAYAPAGRGAPRAAVGVMLVGSGHGGETAAPAAKAVLVTALKSTAR